MIKAIQRTFLKKRAGSIINMSSVVGVKGMQDKQIMQLLRRELLVLQNRFALGLGSRVFVAMQLLQDLLKQDCKIKC
jgi:3-oxoacyl-[acyl-carrier protein] reductase